VNELLASTFQIVQLFFTALAESLKGLLQTEPLCDREQL
jgi:hypothetical protein